MGSRDVGGDPETVRNILTYRKNNKPGMGPIGDSLDDFIAAPAQAPTGASKATAWRQKNKLDDIP